MSGNASRLAEARIRRFRRHGGVDLGKLDEEGLAHVRVGIAHLKKVIYRFRCPVCGNVVENDQDMTPACDGPSWTHDHPITPMTLIGSR